MLSPIGVRNTDPAEESIQPTIIMRGVYHSRANAEDDEL